MAEQPLAAASRRLRGLKPLRHDLDEVDRLRTRIAALEARLEVIQAPAALKLDITSLISARREQLSAIIEDSRGISFAGSDAKSLIGPLVYVLFRGERPIYVGMSTAGASRPLNPAHPVISQVQDTDRLLMWPVKTAKEALHLEALLISRLKPDLNQRGLTYEAQQLLGLREVSRYMR